MSENQNQNGLAAQPVTCNPQLATGCPSAAAGLPSADARPAFSPARGESDRAFEAFRAYLELGPRRRYLAVARKVGVTLRTVQRWANVFDWRGRINTRAARDVEQFAQAENAAHRSELLDAAARAQAFRDRQYALAETILDVAERYLERVDDGDLDLMSFTDACKALDFASRLAICGRESNAAAAPDHTLRDQLAALLDQACGEIPSPAANPNLPAAAIPMQTRS